MLRLITGKLKAYFKNAEKKSEEEKMRLVWFWTIFLMVGILGIWIANVSRNLASLGRNGVEISGLPEFPKTESIDVDGTLREGGELISEYSEQSKAQWINIGDDYIAGKNIFADDGFSILKLKDVKQEGADVILSYNHYYKDVLVLNSRLVLAVDANKAVSERENTLKKGIDISADPAVSAKEATKIAEKEIGDGGYVFKEAVLAIAQEDDGYYLVWQAVFQKGNVGNDIKKILVGAKRGSIISIEPSLGGQTIDQLKNVTE